MAIANKNKKSPPPTDMISTVIATARPPATVVSKVAPELSSITSAALLLCTKLSEVGACVKSVQPEAKRIAGQVQSHWRILDELSQRLNSSDAVHNDNALELMQAIVADTATAFQTIAKLTPARILDGLTYALLVKQRFRWMCKKGEIDALLQRLEFLSSATQLLVTTLIVAEKIRWTRAFGKGGSSEKVVYETLRMRDRPAKYCLADDVVLASKQLPEGSNPVVMLLPPMLSQMKQDEQDGVKSDNDSKYPTNRTRLWWDLLLRRWTSVYGIADRYTTSSSAGTSILTKRESITSVSTVSSGETVSLLIGAGSRQRPWTLR